MNTKSASPFLEEMRVHRNWITLISFCQNTFQYGQLCVKMVGSVPIELNDKLTRPKKRFDSEPQPKIDFSTDEDGPDIIVMKVSKTWVNMITFCQDSIPYGQLCVLVVNAEPRDLVEKHTHAKIRFDKPETIPANFVNFAAVDE